MAEPTSRPRWNALRRVLRPVGHALAAVGRLIIGLPDPRYGYQPDNPQ